MPFWKRTQPQPPKEIDELAISLLQTHCDRTDDAISWASKIAPLTSLNEGQVYWELAILRFFWVRTGAMLNMNDARPLIDRLHWYFLEGIRIGSGRSRESIAEFEQVMAVRMMSYTKGFNDAVGDRDAKAAAVSEQVLAALEVSTASAPELSGYLTKLASRIDDVRVSLIMRGMCRI